MHGQMAILDHRADVKLELATCVTAIANRSAVNPRGLGTRLLRMDPRLENQNRELQMPMLRK